MSDGLIELDGKHMAEITQMLELAPRVVNAAAKDAINRTVTHVLAMTAKSVRQEYLAKAGDIKRTLKPKRATASNLVGTVTSTGRPMLLASFRVSNSATRPLKAQVKRGSASKTVGGMFRGTSHSGYSGLMLRETRAQYPLRVPYGPSVPQMIGSPDVISVIEEDAQAYLERRFLHEVEYRLERDAKK